MDVFLIYIKERQRFRTSKTTYSIDSTFFCSKQRCKAIKFARFSFRAKLSFNISFVREGGCFKEGILLFLKRNLKVTVTFKYTQKQNGIMTSHVPTAQIQQLPPYDQSCFSYDPSHCVPRCPPGIIANLRHHIISSISTLEICILVVIKIFGNINCFHISLETLHLKTFEPKREALQLDVLN